MSIYEDDIILTYKHTYVVDEKSIMVKRMKLMIVLGIFAKNREHPTKHEDVIMLDMKVRQLFFKRGNVMTELEAADKKAGQKAEYAISKGAYNLVVDIKDYGVPHYLDISHTLGNCMKHVYGKDEEFKELTSKLSKIRLKYHPPTRLGSCLRTCGR